MERIDWENIVEKIARWQWAITAMFTAAVTGVWLIFSKNLPPLLPLFYSRPWGEEQLAGPVWLWLPLVISILVASLITLAVKRLKLDSVLAAMLIAAGIISEIILFLGVLRIIFLVT
jgi:hypothetical protein